MGAFDISWPLDGFVTESFSNSSRVTVSCPPWLCEGTWWQQNRRRKQFLRRVATEAFMRSMFPMFQRSPSKEEILNSPNSLHSCGALWGELGAGPSTVTVLLTKHLTSFNFNFVALNAGLAIWHGLSSLFPPSFAKVGCYDGPVHWFLHSLWLWLLWHLEGCRSGSEHGKKHSQRNLYIGEAFWCISMHHFPSFVVKLAKAPTLPSRWFCSMAPWRRHDWSAVEKGELETM